MKSYHNSCLNNNIDVYYKDDNGNDKLLLKFRKNVISCCEINLQVRRKCYKDLAKPSRGRHTSAYPIDPNNDYWKKRKLHNTTKWSTSYLLEDFYSSKMI